MKSAATKDGSGADTALLWLWDCVESRSETYFCLEAPLDRSSLENR